MHDTCNFNHFIHNESNVNTGSNISTGACNTSVSDSDRLFYTYSVFVCAANVYASNTKYTCLSVSVSV